MGKAISILLTIGLTVAILMFSKDLFIVNSIALICGVALSILFPKTFSMGVTEDDKSLLISKLICMGFMLLLIALAQYLKDGIMAGIYAGILINYTARTFVKVVKIK